MTQELVDKLRAAAAEGNLAEMEKLVGEGADVNGFSKQGHTPLVWAANNGKLDAARWLLERGAKVDLGTDKNEWTPLMVAASQGHTATVDLLLESGADIAARKNDGRTVLEILKAENKPDMLKHIAARDPGEISFFHSVADRVMQEVYSFTLKERITLLRKAVEGDVEAIQREPFTALADKGGLTKAFAEHKKRGGKLTDEEVFHGVLPKTKSLSLPRH